MAELNFNTGKYERAGFCGLDVNLDISLNEYRIIWKKYKRANKKKRIQRDEYLFIFINGNNQIDHSFFKITGDKKEYIKDYYSFINWNNVYSFVGQSENEFFENDTKQILTGKFIFPRYISF